MSAATASSQAPEDTTARFGRPAELAAAALVLAAAGVLFATGTIPNYDSYYHLVWGRELLDGTAPSFEAYAAPTQHPLWLAVCALLGVLLGEPADRVLIAVCLLSWAALVLGAYRLGGAAFGRWTGALGALFVAGSASFLLYAVRGYVDMPFLAIVVWAGVVESTRGDRRLVLLLLAIAGLLRPEAWVLAGLYWLWKRELVLLPLAVAAPVLWALVDLAVTGDPLHSITATSSLAEELGRERGLSKVPGAFVEFLAATVRPPVAALALVGLPLAVLVLGWRRPATVLALAAAGVATFVGTGLAGLSILPRYLTVPAVGLCLLAGFALAGWTALPAEHPRRGLWRNLAAGAAVLGAAGIIVLAPTLDRVSAELTFLRTTHAELVALLDTREVTDARRCGPLTFPNYRLVPDARWHLDASRSEVGARSARRRPKGVAIFVLTPKGLERFGFAAGATTTTNIPDPGFTPLARRGRFVAYASC